jgi:A/G-specific adenine glycosylase
MATTPSPDLVDALRHDLLAFFDTRARDLPWRRTGDPYAIWVSEIMLQQTRVETVIPYFERWMERFPDVTALAEADEGEVLKAWEGLGFYRRARNLHRAAMEVRERPAGRVPGTASALRDLPGVGAYTAGAVASIAFGEAVPAVDGNVRRVLCRLFDLADATARELEALAGALVDPGRPGDFNQALMELGATVCTPRSPSCSTCPVQVHCLALARGTVAERPAARPRREVPHEVREVMVVRARPSGAVLMRRRPADGLLPGLWEFPPVEAVESDVGGAGFASAAGAVRLDDVRHAFSHLRVTYRPVLVTIDDAARPSVAHPYRWVDDADRAELALPVAMQRILESAREIVTPAES